MKKILHVINDLGSGGAENLIFNLLPILKNHGAKIELLILRNTKNSLYFDRLSENIKIITINTKNIRSYKNIRKIRKIIEDGNYDIVHAHLFPTIYWTSLALKPSKYKKIDFFITEHSTHNKRRFFIFKPLERYIYKRAKKIVCITEDVRKNLDNFLGSKMKTKTVVIENGINLNVFKKTSETTNNKMELEWVRNNKIILLMVGRFSEAKDQNTIILAMDRLDERYHLIFVGDGEKIIESRKLVKELNLEKRIFFLGISEKVPEIINSVDICIISSKWEGFGLVAVEAMAAQKPIIGTNIPGLSSVIGDDDLLFEVGNVEDLVKKISRFEDSNYYDSKVKQLFERSKKYDINEMSIKYYKLYES